MKITQQTKASPGLSYRNNVEITSFLEAISGVSIIGFLSYLLFFVVILGGMFILMTYGFARMARTNATKRFSPIVFNRSKQTVSAVFNKKEATISWSEVTGVQYLRSVIGPGMIPMHREVIELIDLGMMEGNEALWEYICTFMEEGPDRLKVLPYASDSWDHEPLYSRTFKQAIDHHWFWPVVRNPALGPVISWLVWPIKVVMFIPFILTEWFWRRMMLRAYKKSNNFPEHRFKDCQGKKITGQMATMVARGEEDMDGINYRDLKQRLNQFEFQDQQF